MISFFIYVYIYGVSSTISIFNCFICLQEEDEVPDDETVNQMIARSEEEFEQFMVSSRALTLRV